MSDSNVKQAVAAVLKGLSTRDGVMSTAGIQNNMNTIMANIDTLGTKGLAPLNKIMRSAIALEDTKAKRAVEGFGRANFSKLSWKGAKGRKQGKFTLGKDYVFEPVLTGFWSYGLTKASAGDAKAKGLKQAIAKIKAASVALGKDTADYGAGADVLARASFALQQFVEAEVKDSAKE